MDKFIIDEWLRFAQNDLEAVYHLLKFHPLQIEIICYHCQQSAEKDLKAFLISKDMEDFPRTHDLEKLGALCEEYNKSFEIIRRECSRLTDYGNQPRYPFSLELTEEIMQIAIKDAEKIKEFVKGVINV